MVPSEIGAAELGPAGWLAALPAWGFGLVLVIARVGGLCMLVPAIGEADLPVTVRAGFVLALAALLLPVLGPSLPALPANTWRLAGMILAELLTGLWLGWSSRMMVTALSFAGQLAALATGLASVIQPDPSLGAQNAALGRLLGLAGPVLLLTTGLYRVPLVALRGSYDIIAAGALLPAADTLQTAVAAVGALTGLALRLGAPFLLLSLVGQVALAAIARLVPSLQIFALAAPLQLLAGLLLLALAVASVLAVWRDQTSQLMALMPGL